MLAVFTSNRTKQHIGTESSQTSGSASYAACSRPWPCLCMKIYRRFAQVRRTLAAACVTVLAIHDAWSGFKSYPFLEPSFAKLVVLLQGDVQATIRRAGALTTYLVPCDSHASTDAIIPEDAIIHVHANQLDARQKKAGRTWNHAYVSTTTMIPMEFAACHLQFHNDRASKQIKMSFATRTFCLSPRIHTPESFTN